MTDIATQSDGGFSEQRLEFAKRAFNASEQLLCHLFTEDQVDALQVWLRAKESYERAARDWVLEND